MTYAVVSLRRYPVKSMGGESLHTAHLDARGIVGDRWHAVRDEQGHFASGKNTRRFRRHDPVFRYSATTAADGQVAVSHGHRSWVVGDPALNQHLTDAMGIAMEVTTEGAVPHQDMGAVSIIGTATLTWCAENWGGAPDPRRLRVNIVCETSEPFEEEDWVGRNLPIGSARLHVIERIPRCRMIDIAQDGVHPSVPWLKSATGDRDMFLAMYADVNVPGSLCVGDTF